MTVPATPSRNDSIGTGLVATYDYGFRITAATDLLVTVRDLADVETTLAYPADYSVTGVGSFSGGTITLTAGALASGYALTIRDAPTAKQSTDLRNQSAPYQEALEDALDYVTRVVKSNEDVLGRALTLPETITGVSNTLPAPVAGFALVWNSSEDGLQNGAAVTVPTSPFMATVLDDVDAPSARATLGVPAAANGTHTGTTAVETLAVSVAATVPTRAQADNGTDVATTAFVQAARVSKILPIDASVAANALTITLQPCVLDFRSATLGSGTVNTRTVPAAIMLTVPSSATLGTTSAQQSRLVVLAIDNAGTVELAVVNLTGGVQLDEAGTINTTAISAGSTSASTIYSTSARTGVAYRVVGYVQSTQATAGTWATAPSLIQGVGGQALVALNSLGSGQTWQSVTGSRSSGVTYYNTTGRPIVLLINAFSGTSMTFAVNGVNQVQFANAAATAQLYIVPAGASYSYTISGGGITSWAELR